MGYILPINSYRSQQYANRLMGDSESYSKIAQLHHVNKIGDFMEENKRSVDDERLNAKVKKEGRSLAAAESQKEVIGYVNPNPAHISVKHQPIVNRDAVINAYF